jgi:prolyl-tRNA editing enzyme YbaK/EbsC (Cys-tRNA(Pro) deacylase)
MRTHVTDSSLFLVEIPDLERDPPPERIMGDLEPLRRAVRWAEEYLCRSHPGLGREGPVCPFAQASMRKAFFFLAVCRGTEHAEDSVRTTLMKYRDWFLEIEPRSGGDAAFKTILVLFPDLPQESVPLLIDATQEALKGEYVAKGLMIGEFHAGPPQKAGLWNRDFRPLGSPVPMLVIRHMVPTDFGFLRHDKNLVSTYLERFENQIPAHVREEVVRVARGFGISMPDPADMAVVHPRVREVLRRHRVPFVVHRHRDLLPRVPDGPQDVARALGYPLERITRSVLLRCSCHDRYSVVVCPVNHPLDLAQIAQHLGCHDVEPGSDREIDAILGFSPEGISPIAVAGMPVIVDQALFGYPTVLVGGGELRVEIEIDPARLREIADAQTISLARALLAS